MTDFNLSEDELRLLNIFHPLAVEKLKAAEKKNTRFVHYTTADAAMKILETQQVWMRKISCMNDYMEVRQGLNCFNRAYGGVAGEQFREALDGMFPGITTELEIFSMIGCHIFTTLHTLHVCRSTQMMMTISMDGCQCGEPMVSQPESH